MQQLKKKDALAKVQNWASMYVSLCGCGYICIYMLYLQSVYIYIIQRKLTRVYTFGCMTGDGAQNLQSVPRKIVSAYLLFT